MPAARMRWWPFRCRRGLLDFAALAPQVVESDDPAAVVVMNEAVADVGAAVTVLQGEDGLPVVFLGGLGTVFADRLAKRFVIQAALGTALDGALLLARETQ